MFYKKIILIFIILLILNIITYPKVYKVVVFQVHTSDIFVEFFKAIAKETNNTFDIEVVPPARAIYLIENKMVDICYPVNIGIDPKKNEKVKYDFSSSIISKAVFILYTNKKKPLDISELRKNNEKNYLIETTLSLSHLFDFEPSISTNIEGSLKKVDRGMIDGFIYSQSAGDLALKNLKLKNVYRQLYCKTQLTIAIQKGTKNGELDKIIETGIKKIKANGQLQQIMGESIKSIDVYYDWQP